MQACGTTPHNTDVPAEDSLQPALTAAITVDDCVSAIERTSGGTVPYSSAAAVAASGTEGGRLIINLHHMMGLVDADDGYTASNAAGTQSSVQQF